MRTLEARLRMKDVPQEEIDCVKREVSLWIKDYLETRKGSFAYAERPAIQGLRYLIDQPTPEQIAQERLAQEQRQRQYEEQQRVARERQAFEAKMLAEGRRPIGEWLADNRKAYASWAWQQPKYSPEEVAGGLHGLPADTWLTEQEVADAVEAFLRRPVTD